MKDLKLKLILEMVDNITAPIQRMGRQFATTMSTMTEQAQAFSLRMRDAGKSISDAGKSISDVGGWMSTRISAALALSGREAIETEKKMQAVHSQMLGALSDQKLAEQQIARIRSESDRMGSSFIDTATSYANFSAAFLRSGASIDKNNEVFNNFLETTTAMHMSNSSRDGVFLALQQMASKSTLSMQELSQQLTNYLPGAVNLAAKSMNMSTGKFVKAVESGMIKSKDFIPKFAEVVRKELGSGFENATHGIMALENRTANTLTDVKERATNSGLEQFYRAILTDIDALGRAFLNLSPPMQSFVVKVGLVLAVAGPLIFLLGQLTIGIGGLVIGLGFVTPGLISFALALRTVSIFLLTTPLGWFTLGVAALAGVVYLIYRNWSGIVAFFGRIWGGIKTAFNSGIDAVMNALKPLINVMNYLKDGFGYITSAVTDNAATRYLSESLYGSPSSPSSNSVIAAGSPVRRVDTGGTLHIKIDNDGRARVIEAKPNDRNMDYVSDTGVLMGGAL